MADRAKFATDVGAFVEHKRCVDEIQKRSLCVQPESRAAKREHQREHACEHQTSIQAESIEDSVCSWPGPEHCSRTDGLVGFVAQVAEGRKSD